MSKVSVSKYEKLYKPLDANKSSLKKIKPNPCNTGSNPNLLDLRIYKFYLIENTIFADLFSCSNHIAKDYVIIFHRLVSGKEKFNTSTDNRPVCNIVINEK